MTKQEFQQLKADALFRIRSLDSIDGHIDREPQTILAALETGITGPDEQIRTACLFDAYVMLEEIAIAMREPT